MAETPTPDAPVTDDDALVTLTSPAFPYYVRTADCTYYPVKDGQIQVHPRHVPELTNRLGGQAHQEV